MKNKTNKVIKIVITLVLLIFVCGCGDYETNYTKSIHRGTVEGMYEDGTNEIVVYTDPETHVQYIIWSTPHKGGITPRLNSDGTISVE